MKILQEVLVAGQAGEMLIGLSRLAIFLYSFIVHISSQSICTCIVYLYLYIEKLKRFRNITFGSTAKIFHVNPGTVSV